MFVVDEKSKRVHNKFVYEYINYKMNLLCDLYRRRRGGGKCAEESEEGEKYEETH